GGEGRLQVQLHVDLRHELGVSCCTPKAVTVVPMYDKLIVGTAEGQLCSVLLDPSKHEEAADANAQAFVAVLRAFHKGRVVALACMQPIPLEIADEGAGALALGGEDG
ncbi:unnamed protein product, partial [Chrysoparadoxa australica]